MSANIATNELKGLRILDRNLPSQESNKNRNKNNSLTYLHGDGSETLKYNFQGNGEDRENKKYLVENYIKEFNKTGLSTSKLLRSTIEHSFSTLPASDRHLIATTICNVLDGCSPNNANDGFPYQSKEALVLAIEAAEKRNAEISEIVLLSLINLACAPNITKTILEFLVFEFEGKSQVVSRSKRYPTLMSSIEVACHDSYSKGSSRSMFLCWNRKKLHMKNKRTWTNIQASSILLNVLLISALCSVIIINYAVNTNKTNCIDHGKPVLQSILNDSTSYNISQETSTASTEAEEKEYVVSIKSYNEYIQFFPVFSSAHSFILHISLDNELNWPESCLIFNASLVKAVHFSGHFSFGKISMILRQTENIKSITFDNTGNSLCFQNIQQKFVKSSFGLTDSEHIKLTRISDCAQLFNYINTIIDNSRLTKLTIEDSVLTEKSVEYVQSILMASHNFIQHIRFPNTTFSSEILKSRLGTLGAVVSLEIDIVNDQQNSFVYIPKEIHFILPNLQTFSSKQGYISLNQFRNILKCKELTTITAGLEIPSEQNEINLFSLLGSFIKLSHVNLSFQFLYAGSESCKILGLPELRKNMKFELWHNCTTDDKYVYS